MIASIFNITGADDEVAYLVSFHAGHMDFEVVCYNSAAVLVLVAKFGIVAVDYDENPHSVVIAALKSVGVRIR